MRAAGFRPFKWAWYTSFLAHHGAVKAHDVTTTSKYVAVPSRQLCVFNVTPDV